MKIHLITIGQKMPAWIIAGYNEYANRMPKECEINLIELRLPLRSKKSASEKLIEEEGKLLLSKIPARSHVVVLDEHGEMWDTITLSTHLKKWKMQGGDVALLIGGPHGLAESCLKKANQIWSLSRLTFPHPLVRIIIAEQLYRACAIIAGHPYHRY
jgi:23S rRNA (pseudouridine1915-N3)-methyltransferase